tara:strand:+ start:145 stop:450 length:306 start_codon:yes stop_codon:yes gene_type:complete
LQRIWILEDPESLFESEYYRYTGRNISVKARNPSDIGFHFGKRPDWSVLDIILWLIASVHLSGDPCLLPQVLLNEDFAFRYLKVFMVVASNSRIHEKLLIA